MLPVDYGKVWAVYGTCHRNKGRLVQHILVVKVIFPSKKKI
jgi:hypothetical protein